MGNTPSKSPPQEATAKIQRAEEGSGACPLGFGDGPVKKTGETRGISDASVWAGGGGDGTSSKCPVRQDGKDISAATTATTIGEDDQAAGESSSSSKCPVKQAGGTVTKYLNPHSYDVYGRRLAKSGGGGGGRAVDPSNNMPVNANQQPADGQKQRLSTERVQSTIPKGGTEGTWTYPSPQMFWNSLTRKGKVEDTEESDIDVVVAIHNNMNENTWREILKWESIRWDKSDVLEAEPRLLRFLGRPDDTSPKAMAKMVFGHPLPFDRHDWIVDRGGKERRYVIDYYHDEGVSAQDETPELHSTEAVKSIRIDVRPAADDVAAVMDRVLNMPLKRRTGGSDFVPLPFFPSATLRNSQRPTNPMFREIRPEPNSLFIYNGGNIDQSSQQQQQQQQQRPKTRRKKRRHVDKGDVGNTLPGGKEVNPEDEAELRRVLARMKEECSGKLMALREASAEDEAQDAQDSARAQALSLSLEHCMARLVCPKQAARYRDAVDSLSVLASQNADTYFAETALERRVDSMRGCLNALTERRMAIAKSRHGRGGERGRGEDRRGGAEEACAT